MFKWLSRFIAVLDLEHLRWAQRGMCQSHPDSGHIALRIRMREEQLS